MLKCMTVKEFGMAASPIIHSRVPEILQHICPSVRGFHNSRQLLTNGLPSGGINDAKLRTIVIAYHHELIVFSDKNNIYIFWLKNKGDLECFVNWIDSVDFPAFLIRDLDGTHILGWFHKCVFSYMLTPCQICWKWKRYSLLITLTRSLWTNTMLFWSLVFSLAPSGLISEVLNDSLYFSRDFHLWTNCALQILGYEGLMQSCEVGKYYYPPLKRDEKMRPNLWPDKDNSGGPQKNLELKNVSQAISSLSLPHRWIFDRCK